MITAISIENLRCFRKIRVSPFKRLNLITGENGIGKTTLLEALWLHHGRRNPKVLWNIYIQRGLVPIDFNPLSYLVQASGPVTIIGTEINGTSTRVTINMVKSSALSLAIDSGEIGGRPSRVAEEGRQYIVEGVRGLADSRPETGDEILITYQDGDMKPVEMKGKFQLTQRGLEVVFGVQPLLTGLPSGIIQLAQIRPLRSQTIERFSKVLREGHKDKLIKVLQIVEPRLVNLEVLTQETEPILWGHLDGSQMLPVELLGDGFSRVLSLFVAMYVARGGMIAIDEIENGIYYMALPKLWQSLSEFANIFDIQVFATTHSKECILAAHEALTEKSNVDLIVQRLYRQDNIICAVSYEGEELQTAFETGFEVR